MSPVIGPLQVPGESPARYIERHQAWSMAEYIREHGDFWENKSWEELREIIGEYVAKAQPVGEIVNPVDALRQIAHEAIDILLKIGAYGIHESRRKELHETALKLKKQMEDVS